jgi:hypothetical protein
VRKRPEVHIPPIGSDALEDEESASGAREVARALLTQCLEILAPPGQPSSIHLKMPSRQATLREIALGLGLPIDVTYHSKNLKPCCHRHFFAFRIGRR